VCGSRETVKVPQAGWTNNVVDFTSIKEILTEYISQPDLSTIKDVLEDTERDEYVFSRNGEFYICNFWSDAVGIVLEPKGKAQLWKQTDKDSMKVRLRLLDI
jgi:6-pyruvoyl-tetrahydropterin synthase